MFKTKRAERSASHLSFLNFLFVCVRPEALLKQRTLPSTPRTLSARSGSPNTFPFDRPQTCKHNDSACQQNFKKKKKKKKPMKKNKQKTGKNLQTICYLSSLIGSGINPLWNQSTETVNPGLRIASPRRVDQTHRTWCRWFPLLGETPRFSTSCRWPRPKWIEPDRDIKCHRSDLIWLFDSLWLFHCGGVSLVVQWQWSSVCLMFISFLYSSTYFAVSWN